MSDPFNLTSSKNLCPLLLNDLKMEISQNRNMQIIANSDDIKESIVNGDRYKKLTNELRCLVCQNQTVAESNSGLALDLKNQVAEQILNGKSNDEIFEYMETRYGEFVLYKPQVSLENSFLWLGPLIILFVASLITFKTIRNYSKKNKK